MWKYNNTNELYHHGVLGMKWGVRRYQNKDGSLTRAGHMLKKKRETTNYNKVSQKKSVLDEDKRKMLSKKSKVSSAKKDYKQQKKNYKKSKKDYLAELDKPNEKIRRRSKDSVVNALALNDSDRKRVNRLLNTHKDLKVADARRMVVYQDLVSDYISKEYKNHRNK